MPFAHFGTLSTIIFTIRLFFAFIPMYNPTKLRKHSYLSQY